MGRWGGNTHEMAVEFPILRGAFVELHPPSSAPANAAVASERQKGKIDLRKVLMTAIFRSCVDGLPVLRKARRERQAWLHAGFIASAYT